MAEMSKLEIALGHLASALPVFVGVSTFGGWTVGAFPAGAAVATGQIAIVTTWLYVATGLGLLAYRLGPGDGPSRLSRWLGGLVLAVAAIGLVESLTAGALGLIPEVVPQGPLAGAALRSHPAGEATFVLIATGLLLLNGRRPSGRMIDLLAISAFAIAYASLLVVLFGAPTSHIPVPGAINLILLALALFCSNPVHGLIRTLAAASPGGLVLRRMLPGILLAPPLIGWLRLMAERAGYLDFPGGLALMVLVLSAAGSVFAFWLSRSIDRLEAERRRMFAYAARLAAIVEGSRDAIVSAAPDDGRIVSWNRAAERLFGYSAEEAIGRPIYLLAPPHKTMTLLEAIERLQRGEDVAPFDMDLAGRSGEPVAVSLSLSLVGGRGEQPIAISAVIEDITDRKRSEQALQESEERYRRLVELSPEAIMVERQGQLVFANSAAARMLGLKAPEALLSRSLLDFIHPDDRAEFEAHIRELRARGIPMQQFVSRMVLRPDGDAFVETSAALFTFQSKPAVIIIMRDITVRRRALEEAAHATAELKKMEELNRLKDHFLSTISHEMKTPLALITGYAELLEDAGAEASLVEGIQDGAQRLGTHITSILDYSALISGSLPLYCSELDLAEVIGQVRARMAERLEPAHLKLEVHVRDDLPVIKADERRVAQILTELVENARKFTPEGGTIAIRADVDGKWLRIDISDTGPGIREEDFVRIWQAFSQLDIEDALRKGGLGLGLAIVKMLVELHGGRVAVVSQLGQGATFSIFLPLEPTFNCTKPAEAADREAKRPG